MNESEWETVFRQLNKDNLFIHKLMIRGCTSWTFRQWSFMNFDKKVQNMISELFYKQIYLKLTKFVIIFLVIICIFAFFIFFRYQLMWFWYLQTRGIYFCLDEKKVNNNFLYLPLYKTFPQTLCNKTNKAMKIFRGK